MSLATRLAQYLNQYHQVANGADADAQLTALLGLYGTPDRGRLLALADPAFGGAVVNGIVNLVPAPAAGAPAHVAPGDDIALIPLLKQACEHLGIKAQVDGLDDLIDTACAVGADQAAEEALLNPLFAAVQQKATADFPNTAAETTHNSLLKFLKAFTQLNAAKNATEVAQAMATFQAALANIPDAGFSDAIVAAYQAQRNHIPHANLNELPDLNGAGGHYDNQPAHISEAFAEAWSAQVTHRLSQDDGFQAARPAGDELTALNIVNNIVLAQSQHGATENEARGALLEIACDLDDAALAPNSPLRQRLNALLAGVNAPDGSQVKVLKDAAAAAQPLAIAKIINAGFPDAAAAAKMRWLHQMHQAFVALKDASDLKTIGEALKAFEACLAAAPNGLTADDIASFQGQGGARAGRLNGLLNAAGMGDPYDAFAAGVANLAAVKTWLFGRITAAFTHRCARIDASFANHNTANGLAVNLAGAIFVVNTGDAATQQAAREAIRDHLLTNDTATIPADVSRSLHKLLKGMELAAGHPLKRFIDGSETATLPGTTLIEAACHGMADPGRVEEIARLSWLHNVKSLLLSIGGCDNADKLRAFQVQWHKLMNNMPPVANDGLADLFNGNDALRQALNALQPNGLFHGAGTNIAAFDGANPPQQRLQDYFQSRMLQVFNHQVGAAAGITPQQQAALQFIRDFNDTLLPVAGDAVIKSLHARLNDGASGAEWAQRMAFIAGMSDQDVAGSHELNFLRLQARQWNAGNQTLAMQRMLDEHIKLKETEHVGGAAYANQQADARAFLQNYTQAALVQFQLDTHQYRDTVDELADTGSQLHKDVCASVGRGNLDGINFPGLARFLQQQMLAHDFDPINEEHIQALQGAFDRVKLDLGFAANAKLEPKGLLELVGHQRYAADITALGSAAATPLKTAALRLLKEHGANDNPRPDLNGLSLPALACFLQSAFRAEVANIHAAEFAKIQERFEQMLSRSGCATAADEAMRISLNPIATNDLDHDSKEKIKAIMEHLSNRDHAHNNHHQVNPPVPKTAAQLGREIAFNQAGVEFGLAEAQPLPVFDVEDDADRGNFIGEFQRLQLATPSTSDVDAFTVPANAAAPDNIQNLTPLQAAMFAVYQPGNLADLAAWYQADAQTARSQAINQLFARGDVNFVDIVSPQISAKANAVAAATAAYNLDTAAGVAALVDSANDISDAFDAALDRLRLGNNVNERDQIGLDNHERTANAIVDNLRQALLAERAGLLAVARSTADALHGAALPHDVMGRITNAIEARLAGGDVAGALDAGGQLDGAGNIRNAIMAHLDIVVIPKLATQANHLQRFQNFFNTELNAIKAYAIHLVRQAHAKAQVAHAIANPPPAAALPDLPGNAQLGADFDAAFAEMLAGRNNADVYAAMQNLVDARYQAARIAMLQAIHTQMDPVGFRVRFNAEFSPDLALAELKQQESDILTVLTAEFNAHNRAVLRAGLIAYRDEAGDANAKKAAAHAILNAGLGAQGSIAGTADIQAWLEQNAQAYAENYAHYIQHAQLPNHRFCLRGSSDTMHTEAFKASLAARTDLAVVDDKRIELDRVRDLAAQELALQSQGVSLTAQSTNTAIKLKLVSKATGVLQGLAQPASLSVAQAAINDPAKQKAVMDLINSVDQLEGRLALVDAELAGLHAPVVPRNRAAALQEHAKLQAQLSDITFALKQADCGIDLSSGLSLQQAISNAFMQQAAKGVAAVTADPVLQKAFAIGLRMSWMHALAEAGQTKLTFAEANQSALATELAVNLAATQPEVLWRASFRQGIRDALPPAHGRVGIAIDQFAANAAGVNLLNAAELQAAAQDAACAMNVVAVFQALANAYNMAAGKSEAILALLPQVAKAYDELSNVQNPNIVSRYINQHKPADIAQAAPLPGFAIADLAVPAQAGHIQAQLDAAFKAVVQTAPPLQRAELNSLYRIARTECLASKQENPERYVLPSQKLAVSVDAHSPAVIAAMIARDLREFHQRGIHGAQATTADEATRLIQQWGFKINNPGVANELVSNGAIHSVGVPMLRAINDTNVADVARALLKIEHQAGAGDFLQQQRAHIRPTMSDDQLRDAIRVQMVHHVSTTKQLSVAGIGYNGGDFDANAVTAEAQNRDALIARQAAADVDATVHNILGQLEQLWTLAPNVQIPEHKCQMLMQQFGFRVGAEPDFEFRIANVAAAADVADIVQCIDDANSNAIRDALASSLAFRNVGLADASDQIGPVATIAAIGNGDAAALQRAILSLAADRAAARNFKASAQHVLSPERAEAAQLSLASITPNLQSLPQRIAKNVHRLQLPEARTRALQDSLAPRQTSVSDQAVELRRAEIAIIEAQQASKDAVTAIVKRITDSFSCCISHDPKPVRTDAEPMLRTDWGIGLKAAAYKVDDARTSDAPVILADITADNWQAVRDKFNDYLINHGMCGPNAGHYCTEAEQTELLKINSPEDLKAWFKAVVRIKVNAAGPVVAVVPLTAQQVAQEIYRSLACVATDGQIRDFAAIGAVGGAHYVPIQTAVELTNSLMTNWAMRFSNGKLTWNDTTDPAYLAKIGDGNKDAVIQTLFDILNHQHTNSGPLTTDTPLGDLFSQLANNINLHPAAAARKAVLPDTNQLKEAIKKAFQDTATTAPNLSAPANYLAPAVLKNDFANQLVLAFTEIAQAENPVKLAQAVKKYLDSDLSPWLFPADVARDASLVGVDDVVDFILSQHAGGAPIAAGAFSPMGVAGTEQGQRDILDQVTTQLSQEQNNLLRGMVPFNNNTLAAGNGGRLALVNVFMDLLGQREAKLKDVLVAGNQPSDSDELSNLKSTRDVAALARITAANLQQHVFTPLLRLAGGTQPLTRMAFEESTLGQQNLKQCLAQAENSGVPFTALRTELVKVLPWLPLREAAQSAQTYDQFIDVCRETFCAQYMDVVDAPGLVQAIALDGRRIEMVCEELLGVMLDAKPSVSPNLANVVSRFEAIEAGNDQRARDIRPCIADIRVTASSDTAIGSDESAQRQYLKQLLAAVLPKDLTRYQDNPRACALLADQLNLVFQRYGLPEINGADINSANLIEAIATRMVSDSGPDLIRDLSDEAQRQVAANFEKARAKALKPVITGKETWADVALDGANPIHLLRTDDTETALQERAAHCKAAAWIETQFKPLEPDNTRAMELCLANRVAASDADQRAGLAAVPVGARAALIREQLETVGSKLQVAQAAQTEHGYDGQIMALNHLPKTPEIKAKIKDLKHRRNAEQAEITALDTQKTNLKSEYHQLLAESLVHNTNQLRAQKTKEVEFPITDSQQEAVKAHVARYCDLIRDLMSQVKDQPHAITTLAGQPNIFGDDPVRYGNGNVDKTVLGQHLATVAQLMFERITPERAKQGFFKDNWNRFTNPTQELPTDERVMQYHVLRELKSQLPQAFASSPVQADAVLEALQVEIGEVANVAFELADQTQKEDAMIRTLTAIGLPVNAAGSRAADLATSEKIIKDPKHRRHAAFKDAYQKELCEPRREQMQAKLTKVLQKGLTEVQAERTHEFDDAIPAADPAVRSHAIKLLRDQVFTPINDAISEAILLKRLNQLNAAGSCYPDAERLVDALIANVIPLGGDAEIRGFVTAWNTANTPDRFAPDIDINSFQVDNTWTGVRLKEVLLAKVEESFVNKRNELIGYECVSIRQGQPTFADAAQDPAQLLRLVVTDVNAPVQPAATNDEIAQTAEDMVDQLMRDRDSTQQALFKDTAPGTPLNDDERLQRTKLLVQAAERRQEEAIDRILGPKTVTSSAAVDRRHAEAQKTVTAFTSVIQKQLDDLNSNDRAKARDARSEFLKTLGKAAKGRVADLRKAVKDEAKGEVSRGVLQIAATKQVAVVASATAGRILKDLNDPNVIASKLNPADVLKVITDAEQASRDAALAASKAQYAALQALIAEDPVVEIIAGQPNVHLVAKIALVKDGDPQTEKNRRASLQAIIKRLLTQKLKAQANANQQSATQQRNAAFDKVITARMDAVCGKAQVAPASRDVYLAEPERKQELHGLHVDKVWDIDRTGVARANSASTNSLQDQAVNIHNDQDLTGYVAKGTVTAHSGGAALQEIRVKLNYGAAAQHNTNIATADDMALAQTLVAAYIKDCGASYKTKPSYIGGNGQTKGFMFAMMVNLLQQGVPADKLLCYGKPVKPTGASVSLRAKLQYPKMLARWEAKNKTHKELLAQAIVKVKGLQKAGAPITSTKEALDVTGVARDGMIFKGTPRAKNWFKGVKSTTCAEEARAEEERGFLRNSGLGRPGG